MGTAWKASSKVVQKTLEPVWKETFVVPLPHIDLDDWAKPQLTLQVLHSVRRDAFDAIRRRCDASRHPRTQVEDWDEISSADAMGCVNIDSVSYTHLTLPTKA